MFNLDFVSGLLDEKYETQVESVYTLNWSVNFCLSFLEHNQTFFWRLVAN